MSIARIRSEKEFLKPLYPYLLSTAIPLTILILGWSTGPAYTQVPRDVSAMAANDLDRDVKSLRFEALERNVVAMPNGLERDYFAGILANRCGRIRESVRLLEKAIPTLRTKRPDRAAKGLETLADDYLKAYRYADAANTYEDLLTHFAGEIDKNNLDTIKDDYGVIKLLAKAPPQTVSMNEPIHLETRHSPIGSIDADLTVNNNITAPWILDTGANFSVVSASFAKRLGVQPSLEEAQTKGTVNGIENRLHVGILPQLNIGGAVVHDVVLLIFKDETLRLRLGPDRSYQINAILGFPVFQILGSASFSKDGGFEAGLHTNRSASVARMFMNKLTPLIECSVDGRQVLFSFDTGANASTFSVRYFRDFPNQFKGLQKSSSATGGAGGTTKSQVYLLPQVKLRIADRDVVLRRISVLPVAAGTDVDDAYGNLGRDVVGGFETFTMDFTHMTFSFGEQDRQ